jgi:beta-lactamase regulating signal transducer with metallopeptidase domain/predicted  nucleic acid-binding Zn-ribbon protein
MNPLLPALSALASLPSVSSLSTLLAAGMHSPWVRKLGWALLHFVGQGALIGCVTALLLALLRNARPQSRYALACISLGLCLALPLARVLLPADMPDLAALLQGVGPGATAIAPNVSNASNASNASNPALNPAALAGAASLGVANGSAAGGSAAYLGQFGASFALAWLALTPWVVLIWALGMVFFSVRMLCGLLWLHRLQQGSAGAQGGLALQHAKWQQTLNRLAQGFGLTRPIRLRLVNGLDSPVTAGWWRPVVLVPAALLSGMPPDFLEALLAHELAHLKRFDFIINLLQNAIETLLFYHPAVWWISKQIRIEREQIADDLAASRLGDTRRLALALQQLDLFQSSTNQFAMAANGGILMTRIKRLIRPETRNLNWKAALPLAALAMACAALYSNVQAGAPMASTGITVATVGAATTTAAPAVVAASAVPATPSTPATSTVTTRTTSAATAPAAPQIAPVVPPVARTAAKAPPAPPIPPELPTPPEPSMLPEPPPPPELALRQPKFKYALVAGKSGKVISNGTEVGQLAQLSKIQADGQQDLLWFQKDGKAYLVTDPALVAQAMAAHHSTEKPEREMADLQVKVERESRDLEAQIGKLDTPEQSAAIKELEAKVEKMATHIGAIAGKLGEIGAQMGKHGAELGSAKTDAERAQLREFMTQLQGKMEPLQKEMAEAQKGLNAEAQRLAASLGPMHGQNRESSRKIRDTARQMARLGRERARLERDASRSMGDIIEKAMAAGAAKAL